MLKHSAQRLFFNLWLLMTLITPSLSWSQDLNSGTQPLSNADPSYEVGQYSQTLNTSTTFLPVEQAYRLTAQKTDNEVLQLQWHIADGYYLYRDQFRLQINGEAVQLTMPAGTEKYDEVFEANVVVYYQQVTLKLPLPEGTAAATITIRSQGCADAGLCYPPRDQRLSPSPDGIAISETGLKPPSTAPIAPSGTLLSALIGAILGGLILNLMPCVFPVLSLKALALSNNHQSAHQRRLHGIAYTLGSVATFTLIAGLLLIARQTGLAIGWGFQLQSPAFVAALAYLFFSMGLLLYSDNGFGSSWAGLGEKLTRGESKISSFFTGALACVVASPCTAPFMAGALGFAITQPASVALLVFAALGLGMALPFLLLSWMPHFARWLPSPGRWMVTFRQLMAFPMALTAIWLLWVLGRQAGTDAMALTLCGGVLLAFALWLASSDTHKTLRSLLAICSVALALTLITHISPRQDKTLNDTGWTAYSESALQAARNSGQPVFVNLTAAWCITCLANEKVVLSRPAVTKAFQDTQTQLIKGDWTHYDPAITGLLERFNRSGVPLYLYYPAGAREAIVLPQILKQSTLLEVISPKAGT